MPHGQVSDQVPVSGGVHLSRVGARGSPDGPRGRARIHQNISQLVQGSSLHLLARLSKDGRQPLRLHDALRAHHHRIESSLAGHFQSVFDLSPCLQLILIRSRSCYNINRLAGNSSNSSSYSRRCSMSSTPSSSSSSSSSISSNMPSHHRPLASLRPLP